MIEVRGLRAGEAAGFAALTFPAYRHLLAGEPARQLLGERSEVVRPLAVVAAADREPVGLALAAVPLEPTSDPELLSLFVAAPHRRQGVGDRLLGLVEESLAALGHDRVRVVYTTGRPGAEALERLLGRRGWRPPSARMAVVRLSWDQLRQAPWLGRYRAVAGCQTLPWGEVSAAAKEEARRRHEAQPWIHPLLAFWVHEAEGFEPVTSLGICHREQLVGWIINHRHDPLTLRLTCAFIRDDLARLGLLLPAAAESFSRMPQAGFRRAMFTTPRELGRMLAFVDRWVRPWADFVGETRGSSKDLRPEVGR